jgi:hypothetical protein
MKFLTGCLVLALLGASTAADAWPWSRNRSPNRLPKPIDSPIVRPKQKAEKVKRQEHPKRYNDSVTWGQEWDRTLDTKRPKEGNHSLYEH